ncbi:C-factor [Lentinus tigrinus ALCF2SS1-7]|uniref:C-factor n=1 Tax=Lentinus tigrinus ALCF2SS1-6 TaxID=1328759 RepID=A0A5C2SB83_9APHY|nr:C-factor [Lentinus tigrinus ALCF2SS1-6]RPD70923.1 C-factor [Lentinus tigrinus ALCF2SS1-7]
MTTDRQYTWLITGCSRGIGLDLTKRLLESSENFIIAAVRNPEKATALQALTLSGKGTLIVIKLDVDNADAIIRSVEEVKAILGDRGLDYLINNAAVNQEIDKPFTMKIDGWTNVFRTNVVAPALMAQVYLPLVERSTKKTIVNVSSSLASFGVAHDERWASYSVTKAALDMLTHKQHKERPDLMIICLNPGWVKTDMGTQDAFLTLDESVPGIVQTLTSLRPEDNGRLVDYRHEILPW